MIFEKNIDMYVYVDNVDLLIFEHVKNNTKILAREMNKYKKLSSIMNYNAIIFG